MRKKSMTSSESLEDEEILEKEKHDPILEQMQMQDQLKQDFEIPDLDQQDMSSGSEEESEEYDLEDEENEEDAQVEERLEEDRGDSADGNQAEDILDTQLIENLNLVMGYELDGEGSATGQRLRSFRVAYKAAVMYYFYYKKKHQDGVHEHPVIKQLTELNNLIPFYLQQVQR